MSVEDEMFVDIAYDNILKISENAIQFEIQEEEVWIPKSCIDTIWMGEFVDCIERGTGLDKLDEVPVKEWFAIQEGLV